MGSWAAGQTGEGRCCRVAGLKLELGLRLKWISGAAAKSAVSSASIRTHTHTHRETHPDTFTHTHEHRSMTNDIGQAERNWNQVQSSDSQEV